MKPDDIDEITAEPLEPVRGTFDVASMARGEPGLPMRFRWRNAEHQVARVIEKWKTTSPCRHGSGEMYVHKHWLRVVTCDGTTLTVYFERQPRSARDRKRRWWVAAVKKAPKDSQEPLSADGR